MVELFMMGTWQAPASVYSLIACRMLATASIMPVVYNVDADEAARARALEISGVDIFPQLVIDGEYVGGGEVLCELIRTGQLARYMLPVIPG